MTGKRAGVEPGAAPLRFDDIGDGSAGKARSPHRAALVDRSEDRAGLDTSRVQPIPRRLDRASNVTPSNGDRHARALLIGLAASDGDQKPGFDFSDIGNIQGYQL